ncbi:MAG: hypothetical protein JXX29_09945 [Deltaproteobacteria bacterium]|nr:hypothetical protein [Deltaproteobacteria bacterium]MBN2671987.1 hypothetical protein [Deltaproteobacteria bacterium]
MVRLFGGFTCRSCGSQVALNHMTLSGYLCGNCGIQQQFDWELWQQIVEHAHNTADITGFGQPEFADESFWRAFEEKQDEDIARMFRSIGRDKSTLTKGNSYFGGVAFEIDVTPGNPLCTVCSAPLQPRLHENGLLLQCETCEIEHVYRKPSDVPYNGLVAAAAVEHRDGAREVTVETVSSGAAAVIRCPECSGNLDVNTLGEVVSCPFCSASVVVPSRLMQQVNGKAVPKRAWWVAFTGKSPWRIEVEDELGRQTLRRSRERAEMERRRRQEADKAIRDAEKQRRLFRIIMIILALLTAAVIVAIFLV